MKSFTPSAQGSLCEVSTSSDSLSRSTTLNGSSPTLSHPPPSTIPLQPPSWASEAYSILDDLKPKPMPEPEPKPVSGWTKFATQFTKKLPSWCSATRPLSKYVSHLAPFTQELSFQETLIKGLCDDMQTVVEAYEGVGKIQKTCAGMSKFLKDKLVPVHCKRLELSKTE